MPLAILLGLVISGCGAACPIIDLAAKACPVVVAYLGEDGVKHSVELPPDLMTQATAVAASKQGLAPPKGTDTSSGVIEAPAHMHQINKLKKTGDKFDREQD